MPLDRLNQLMQRFRDRIASAAATTEVPDFDLDASIGRELLQSMLLTRHLDRAAHELRRDGLGHYTICSTGHESNAVLGRLTRVTDPALLHYRSAAVQVERARQVPDVDPAFGITQSLVASTDDPMSGGRHKVLGHPKLGITPSTSTIASHLPRAVGLAFGLERKARLRLDDGAPRDAIVVASFGDASLNHSTALGAFNAVGWVLQQNLTLPLLFVCEDNGLGISVRSPDGWVHARLNALPNIRYYAADGGDLAACYLATEAAVQYCRSTRRAAVLHLKTVRLLGHAGSDVDTTYRSPAELEAAFSLDPVTRAALGLIDVKAASAQEVLAWDDAARARVDAESSRARKASHLKSRAEVSACLAKPVDSSAVIGAAKRYAAPHPEAPLTLAQGINTALGELLDTRKESLIFGQDVAKKGGVYGLTKGLLSRGGAARVFNTLLDEQTILGLALGTAQLGMLPVPEIQYLAYLHNAEDQLRGEAATFSFFSAGALDNPMLVRVAGLAYQKGFGGHFHNDNSIAVLRDIPGLIVICPARGDDALELYRTAFALATESRRVVVSIEPIALYHTRDLFADGDGAWAAPSTAAVATPFEPRVYEPDAPDLTIASYGNGLFMSLRAARRLFQETGARARVVDLRFLCPLPTDAVLHHARETGTLLVVDECRRSGNVSEALATTVLESAAGVRFARVTAADCFVPLGDAANLVLASEDEVYGSARELLLLKRASLRPGAR